MDQLTVQKNGVKKIRLSQFGEQYLNEQTKDMTFVISDPVLERIERIPAHRIILSTRSHVFKDMLFGKFKESEDKQIELKDTPIEGFKQLLKFIYFEEFDSNDIKDYSMAIDVFKLSNRFEVHILSDLIEEELIKMIVFDNFMIMFEFSTFYKLNKLSDALKEFLKQNESQIIANIEKALVREPIETIEKILNLMKLSQKQLITALANIADKNPDQDMKKYRVLIKSELCSLRDLNILRNIHIFDTKELNAIIERKFEELETRYEGLTTIYEASRAECEEKNAKYVELSNKYVELNSKYIGLIANYNEVKDVFGPFIEGTGGRVNQFVYNKTNCYLGKLTKRVYFKY